MKERDSGAESQDHGKQQLVRGDFAGGPADRHREWGGDGEDRRQYAPLALWISHDDEDRDEYPVMIARTMGRVAASTSETLLTRAPPAVNVTAPTASTVPTRIWLGRSTARSTSEILVDFSTATVVAIAVPANSSASIKTIPTAKPTVARLSSSTGATVTRSGGWIDWRPAICPGSAQPQPVGA